MALGKLPDEDPASGSIFAEINITPLTDIFLVLLIIFMVSSSVRLDDAARAGIKVNLPKGESHDIDQAPKSLVVSVLKTNEVFVNGQPVKEEDLKNLFVSSVGKDSTTQVIIEADEGVAHGTVVHVMELAKDAGLVKLAIATRSSSQP